MKKINDVTIKIDIDTTEAMKKLAELKEQLQEILELQNRLA